MRLLTPNRTVVNPTMKVANSSLMIVTSVSTVTRSSLFRCLCYERSLLGNYPWLSILKWRNQPAYPSYPCDSLWLEKHLKQVPFQHRITMLWYHLCDALDRRWPEMTQSMFFDDRSEVLRILPIALDQQPKNTNAPIRYHSRLFNPKKQYPIVSSSGQGLISYGTRTLKTFFTYHSKASYKICYKLTSRFSVNKSYT